MILRYIINLLLVPIYLFKRWMVRRLLALRAKLQFSTIRTAISEADNNKIKTQRKNMVLLNSHDGVYEPYQKKALKDVANATKNNSNKKMTPGRLRVLKPKKRVLDHDRIKIMEKKSLYVTK